MGPHSPKKTTFVGSFFKAFFDHILEGPSRGPFSPHWVPKAPKRRPQGSLLRVSFGHFLDLSEKSKIELSLQSELNI